MSLRVFSQRAAGFSLTSRYNSTALTSNLLFPNNNSKFIHTSTASSTFDRLKLIDGNTIPQFGLGTYLINDADAVSACRTAITTGYRHIDTASIYKNETGVGKGVVASGVPREEVFITSKCFNTQQGYDAALTALDESLSKLNTPYLDLYLVHWPCPGKDLYVDTWKALIKAQKDGKVKSIGVSNFLPDHMDRIIAETGVTPAVNQIELHPFFQQRDVVAYHEAHNIATEPWGPLARGAGRVVIPPIVAIADKYKKTPYQIVLRWHIQKRYIVFPKSGAPSRIQENFSIFDFTLDEEDMKAIDALDKMDGRLGPDPRTMQ